MEKTTENNVVKLMEEIREITKHQKAVSKADEVRVMTAMLNDPEFTITVYDKNKGAVGSRCPREEAVKFLSNTASSITGIDQDSAYELASNYEFTKKDASFLIENGRDFTRTYLSTGRKFNIVQSEDAEAAIFYRPIASKEKITPNSDTPVNIPAYEKVICKSKNPKYHKS